MRAASRVKCRQRAGQMDCHGERLRQGKAWLARQHRVQALAGERFQEQGHARTVFNQGDRLEDLGSKEGLQQHVFVSQAVSSTVSRRKLDASGVRMATTRYD